MMIVEREGEEVTMTGWRAQCNDGKLDHGGERR